LQINPDDPTALAAAMEQALTDTEWRETTRRAGLERARLFTWEQTASIVLSVYHAVGEN
jgi:glycosyltransferase involved in cell wall biosynthesis